MSFYLNRRWNLSKAGNMMIPLNSAVNVESVRLLNFMRSYYYGRMYMRKNWNSPGRYHHIPHRQQWGTRRFIFHDDVIKWKHFTRYWPFVRGIHRSPVNSPHKGQWRGALIYYLICVWINGWVNNREADDLRRYCAHYDGIVMFYAI